MDRRNTIIGLRKLLLTIYDEQESDWSFDTLTRRKPNAKARELWEYQMWSQVYREELEKWLSEFEQADDTEHEQNNTSKKLKEKPVKAMPPKLDVDFSKRHKFMYLPPLEKNAEFVPILSLKCKLNEKKTSVRIKVMLIRLGESRQKPFGIGFRLENPEYEHQTDENEDGSKEGGRHDFYHAQLLDKFDYGPQINSLDWIPTSQPSFPLLAKDPVTLLFSLLVTLYGKKYCVEFYNNHRANLPDLSEYIEKLKTQLAEN